MTEKRNVILGIDASLYCTGWALLDLRSDELIDYGNIRTEAEKKRDNYYERVFVISEELVNVCKREDVGIAAVAIEQLNSFRGGEVTRRLAGVSKIIQFRIWQELGMVPNEMNTKTMKAVFTGMGGAVKSLVVNTANQRFKSSLRKPLIYIDKKDDKQKRSDEDIADAISAAYTLKVEIGKDLVGALPQFPKNKVVGKSLGVVRPQSFE